MQARSMEARAGPVLIWPRPEEEWGHRFGLNTAQ